MIRHKHVVTLARRVGLCALYRKPNTRHGNPAHPVYT